jgi:hypothetical protein
MTEEGMVGFVTLCGNCGKVQHFSLPKGSPDKTLFCECGSSLLVTTDMLKRLRSVDECDKNVFDQFNGIFSVVNKTIQSLRKETLSHREKILAMQMVVEVLLRLHSDDKQLRDDLRKVSQVIATTYHF